MTIGTLLSYSNHCNSFAKSSDCKFHIPAPNLQKSYTHLTMYASSIIIISAIKAICHTRPHFYQTRSAWSMDQGSNRKHSALHNFAPIVTKFCVMWEGLSLPQDTKFGNCGGEIVDKRVIFSWALIHESSWSVLIKVEPWDYVSLYSSLHHNALYFQPYYPRGLIM